MGSHFSQMVFNNLYIFAQSFHEHFDTVGWTTGEHLACKNSS